MEWDTDLPEDLAQEWSNWCKEMPELEDLVMKRCVLGNVRHQRSVQMHVSTDASPNAYGAVACVRIVDEDGNVSARLLTAKSKVAPIKRLKLSRLELVGAVIESRLMNFLQSTLDLKNVECFSWTGSTLAFCLI